MGLSIARRSGVDCDVLVAGAGPAGASVAARLARRGYDVILADRARFPRDKVCGDFVGPAAIAELDDLGVTGGPEWRASNRINGASVHLDGRQLIEQSLPRAEGLPAHGRVIPRMVLDQWIFDAAVKAGARPLQGHAVAGYEIGPRAVSVRFKGEAAPLRARLLIGADGSASAIARQLAGGKPDRLDRIVAVRAYFEGVEGPEDRCDLLFAGASFPGYGWLFPTGPGTANVGVGMVLETLPPPETRLADLLADLVAKDTQLRARLSRARQIGTTVGWPLMTYNRARPVIGERVLLVGDAAGLINPLNGEGIQYALESGRWAAEAAARSLAAGQLDAAGLAGYVRTLRLRMDYDMALAGLIVRLIRNRRLNGLWLTALRIICERARRDEAYAEVAGGILAGIAPAKSAVSVRMIAGTLEQAALTLGFGSLRAALAHPAGLTGAASGLAGEVGAAVPASAAEWRDWLVWLADVTAASGRLAGHVGVGTWQAAVAGRAPAPA